VTFAAVGSPFAATASTFSLTPHAAGDFIVIEVISETSADYATALSSGNVTWTTLVSHVTLGSYGCTVFLGHVTSASAATVTVTLSAGSPVLRIAGMEFSTTAGYQTVTLDTSGTVSSITADYPSLTPSHGAGELYFGYAFNAGTATAGSTSGFTYYIDANGNGLAYNAACTSSAQQPAWGASDGLDGVAVLLYEQITIPPFTAPHAVPARHPAARKGKAAGSPGAPWTAPPPPPANAVLDTTGAAVEDTAGQPVEDTSPPTTPAPFAQPNRAPAPHPAAGKGAQAGSPGAAYVYVPVVPAPFAQPDRAVTGRPAARKGTAAGSPGAPVRPQPALFAQPHKGVRGASPRRAAVAHGSPGAPWSPRLPAAVFAQPNKAVAGRRAARKGSAAGSPASAYTPLVQETSGFTTGTTLTLTFPNPATIGHAVIIALCGFPSGSVSSIAVGGVTGTFAQAVATATGSCQVWANYSLGQSSATVTITTSTAGIAAWAYEVAGSVRLDTTASDSGSGTSWSSGNTGETTGYFTHFVVGLGTVVSSTASITPTGAGWTNEKAYAGVADAGSHFGGVSGYQLTSAAGAYAYIGTAGTASAWASVTAAFLAAPEPVDFQPAWGGYVWNGPSFTGISATFTLPATMPAVSQSTALVSVWIGLGNVNQVGVYLGYSASETGGVYTSPWSWWIFGAGEIWGEGTYPAGAGDSLTLSMTLTSTDWYMTMQNNTRDWTYTEVMSVLATNLNCWNIASTSPYAATAPGWIYPVTTAEVIIEKEASQAADYGSITFTSVTTTPAITQQPVPVITVNTDIDQYPGPWNPGTGSGGSFTMYWNAPS
jgi:hypothetical protein